MANDETTLTDEQRVVKEAEKAKLEQEGSYLEREIISIDRDLAVIKARQTTAMFRDGVGSGLPAPLKVRLMDAELLVRLADSKTYQSLVKRQDDLSERLSQIRRSLDDLMELLYPDRGYSSGSLFHGSHKFDDDFED